MVGYQLVTLQPLFADHKAQIEKSMDENNRTQEEKDNFQFALDIDVYFSEDAEAILGKNERSSKSKFIQA